MQRALTSMLVLVGAYRGYIVITSSWEWRRADLAAPLPPSVLKVAEDMAVSTSNHRLASSIMSEPERPLLARYCGKVATTRHPTPPSCSSSVESVALADDTQLYSERRRLAKSGERPAPATSA